jgi:hypothetical protein
MNLKHTGGISYHNTQMKTFLGTVFQILKVGVFYIVTAQLNQTRVGVTRQLVSNPPHHHKLLDHFQTT